MIETLLRTSLLGSADILAIVGDRVFALEAEGIEPGAPYIVYSLLRGNRGASLRGSTDCREARIEINCYAKQYKVVKELAGHAQDVIESSFDCIFNGDQDFNEKETGLKRVMLDYTFWEND